MLPEVRENQGRQRHPIFLLVLEAGAISRLSFPTLCASERLPCPWLSRAFLPEICLTIESPKTVSPVTGPQGAGDREMPQEYLDQMKLRGRAFPRAQPAWKGPLNSDPTS